MPNYWIYRNVKPLNLNWLLSLVVAKWKAVRFNAEENLIVDPIRATHFVMKPWNPVRWGPGSHKHKFNETAPMEVVKY